MKHINESNEWKSLEKHHQALKFYTHQDFSTTPTQRNKKYLLSHLGIQFDYSQQRVNDETLKLLCALAEASGLRQKIQALLRGDIVNPSERIPALHTALRASKDSQIYLKGEDVIVKIHETQSLMIDMAQKIRDLSWKINAEQSITDIVHVGIGGSDLGPRFTHQALSDCLSAPQKFHFISDVCPIGLKKTLHGLNPKTTLFIIASKSMTTPETLENFEKICHWAGVKKELSNQFIAVTANLKAAKKLGFRHVLPIWDFIGGRYSICSAINFVNLIAFGKNTFRMFLEGARLMDEHFRESPFSQNMPVMLALLGIWNINFNHITNLIQLTYGQPLDLWTSYLSQLDMESNGKSIDIHGRAVNYATGPIIWGGSGNQAQHSFYQLITQGTHQFAIDFLSIKTLNQDLINQFCRSKRLILSQGIHAPKNQNGFIPGNIPINHIELEALTPKTLGALVALYEHKIYVQSQIWEINPFDQPGVEHAKLESKIREVP